MIAMETQRGYAEQLRSEPKRTPVVVRDLRLEEKARRRVNAPLAGYEFQRNLAAAMPASSELFTRAARVSLVDPDPFANDRVRWDKHLKKLEGDVASGRLTAKQFGVAREVWSRAVAQTPQLRPPRAGLNADGEYYFDWKFSDLPGLTLTLTFTREGQVDWFFRDKENDVAVGTEEEPTERIPGEVFTYLRLFQR